MSPPSVLVSDGDLSDAFFHQFSTVIRLKSHLRGDHSEDVIGPARRHWVVRHMAEVARAQGFTSHQPTPAAVLNVHARECITPLSTQTTTSSGPGYLTPWYNSFNLADQGVYDPSGPYLPTAPIAASYPSSHPSSPYVPFHPAESTAYHQAVRGQLFQSSNRQGESHPSASSGHLDINSNLFRGASYHHPRSQLSSTPPNNSPCIQYPSTPPNRAPRHPRQISRVHSSPDLVVNATLRSNTQPIAKSTTMAAPNHYQAFEVYALDVQIGDYIQSVKNPGM